LKPRKQNKDVKNTYLFHKLVEALYFSSYESCSYPLVDMHDLNGFSPCHHMTLAEISGVHRCFR